jgi:hypothetical protein
MDEKIKLNIRPGVMLPVEDYFLFRDSYNQVWKLTRNSNPHIPFIISLHENLNPFIDSFENILRKLK